MSRAGIFQYKEQLLPGLSEYDFTLHLIGRSNYIYFSTLVTVRVFQKFGYSCHSRVRALVKPKAVIVSYPLTDTR